MGGRVGKRWLERVADCYGWVGGLGRGGAGGWVRTSACLLLAACDACTSRPAIGFNDPIFPKRVKAVGVRGKATHGALVRVLVDPVRVKGDAVDEFAALWAKGAVAVQQVLALVRRSAPRLDSSSSSSSSSAAPAVVPPAAASVRV